MLAFLIGLFIGASLGILTAGLLSASKIKRLEDQIKAILFLLVQSDIDEIIND